MADSEVKVKITAEDKSQQGFSSFRQEAEKSKEAMEKYKGTMGDVVEATTGFSVSQLSVMAGLAAISNEVKKTISEYSAYAESVDKMSMSTGMATEETSRLIQVADDFRVEQEALGNAMKIALQNGFNPTTENLAVLADRFNEIKDPTQRAAEMQKIFGKSWEDLVPLLRQGGDAIREASAGIDEALVLSKEAIETNRKYQKSVDDLSDSWTAFKYGLTKDVMPALADTLAANAESLAMQKEGASRAEVLAHRNQELAAATSDWSDAQREAAKAAQYAGETTKAVTVTNEDLLRSYSGLTASSREAFDSLTYGSKEAADAQKALTEAAEKYADVQKSFTERYADKAVSALDKAGVKGADYEKALGQIDQQLGTTYLSQKKANDQLDEAIKNYQNTHDISAFGQALNTNKGEWENLDQSMKTAKTDLLEAQKAWEGFKTSLKAADGMNIRINVEASGGGSAYSSDAGTQGTGRHGGEAFASGGSFIVPAGYPNDSYPLGPGRWAQSGEQVTVTPAGETSGNGIAIYGNITIVANNPREFATALAQQSRRSAQAGATYAGR